MLLPVERQGARSYETAIRRTRWPESRGRALPGGMKAPRAPARHGNRRPTINLDTWSVASSPEPASFCLCVIQLYPVGTSKTRHCNKKGGHFPTESGAWPSSNGKALASCATVALRRAAARSAGSRRASVFFAAPRARAAARANRAARRAR